MKQIAFGASTLTDLKAQLRILRSYHIYSFPKNTKDFWHPQVEQLKQNFNDGLNAAQEIYFNLEEQAQIKKISSEEIKTCEDKIKLASRAYQLLFLITFYKKVGLNNETSFDAVVAKKIEEFLVNIFNKVSIYNAHSNAKVSNLSYLVTGFINLMQSAEKNAVDNKILSTDYLIVVTTNLLKQLEVALGEKLKTTAETFNQYQRNQLIKEFKQNVGFDEQSVNITDIEKQCQTAIKHILEDVSPDPIKSPSSPPPVTRIGFTGGQLPTIK